MRHLARDAAAIENVLHLPAHTPDIAGLHPFQESEARIAVRVCGEKRSAFAVLVEQSMCVQLGNDANLQRSEIGFDGLQDARLV
jgi:hypothetical protein